MKFILTFIAILIIGVMTAHKLTQARAAYERIAEWHEINAVMPFCKTDLRGSCYPDEKSNNMITLDAAKKLLSLCKNSNELACIRLMRRAPNRITLDAAKKLLSLCKNSNELACITLMRRAPNRR